MDGPVAYKLRLGGELGGARPTVVDTPVVMRFFVALAVEVGAEADAAHRAGVRPRVVVRAQVHGDGTLLREGFRTERTRKRPFSRVDCQVPD